MDYEIRFIDNNYSLLPVKSVSLALLLFFDFSWNLSTNFSSYNCCVSVIEGTPYICRVVLASAWPAILWTILNGIPAARLSLEKLWRNMWGFMFLSLGLGFLTLALLAQLDTILLIWLKDMPSWLFLLL